VNDTRHLEQGSSATCPGCGVHRHTVVTRVPHTVEESVNPLPTKANCFRKQESMYKVLTPNIKPPI